jgi:hypothetical protein
MLSKSREELEEILEVGSSKLEQFNTRLSKDSIKKLNIIMGILQLSNIGRLTKQASLEYIINQQFAIIMKEPQGKTFADQLAREHKKRL